MIRRFYDVVPDDNGGGLPSQVSIDKILSDVIDGSTNYKYENINGVEGTLNDFLQCSKNAMEVWGIVVTSEKEAAIKELIDAVDILLSSIPVNDPNINNHYLLGFDDNVKNCKLLIQKYKK